MTAIISIQDLTKRYGRRTAVERLNLEVQEGDIYGFVGPNGAGKTSTIRVMSTLLQSDGGDVFGGGHSVRTDAREVRRVIGYMPDYFGVYDDMKVWEYLDFFGACYAIPSAERRKLIDDLLELVDLAHRREDMVDKLSRGMKQRLSLARTLIHDPKILILDEPASGLDPRARVEIRELLLELARMGKTIFFSTHILSDVSEICTHIGIIEKGEMVASGGIEDLQQIVMPQRRIQLTVLGSENDIEKALAGYDGISKIERLSAPSETRTRLEFDYVGQDQDLSELLRTLVNNGLDVVHFSEERRDLEEVFMRITKGLVS